MAWKKCVKTSGQAEPLCGPRRFLVFCRNAADGRVGANGGVRDRPFGCLQIGPLAPLQHAQVFRLLLKTSVEGSADEWNLVFLGGFARLREEPDEFVTKAG